MNSTRPIKPTITDNDRFVMTFFLATIFHGIIILGVTFSISPSVNSESASSLDIILLKKTSPIKVSNNEENIDFLAQSSQIGGGSAKKQQQSSALFSSDTPTNDLGLSAQTVKKKIKQKERQTLLSQKYSTQAITIKDVPIRNKDEVAIDKNLHVTQAVAKISNTIESHTSLDKTKYLNSSTKEFIPAEYMRNWINRVERVGNLNYPDQARKNKLSGTLILNVVINADGNLIKIDLRESSGHQILDDAAKRIVKLASPFTSFPEKLQNEAEIIHITRSWEFYNNSSIRTR